MDKNNNKGFMLAEVIIVSAVLITTIVGLYSGFSNTYQAYEVKKSYYDVNTLYALKNLEDFLIDELLLNKIITTNNFDYIEITTDSFELDYHKQFLDNFNTTYNINKSYLLKYNENSINNLSLDKDEEFKNYLEFYIDSIYEESDGQKFDDTLYSYLLISITNDNTYAALRIR